MHLRCLLTLAALFTGLSAAVSAPVPLFDGKSLEGWQGDPKVWQVKEGQIVASLSGPSPQSDFLTYKATYRNFRFKLEYKILSADGLQSAGAQFRSHLAEPPQTGVIGYRADLAPGVAGQMFDAGRRDKVLAPELPVPAGLEKAGEWNKCEIRCEGPRITILLNGKMTADFSERMTGVDKAGLVALSLQGNGKAQVAFRAITVDILPEDLVPPEDEILHRFGDPKEGPLPAPFSDGKFALNDHEVIVFSGQTNLVREQQAGELESLLASAFAAKKPSFRSMAWEGDTVYEQWRDLNFGSWLSQLQAAGATTVVVQFGQIEALDGPARLPEFTAAYHQLLNQFAARTPRLVLLSPMPFEKPLADHAPDLTLRNAEVKAYSEAIKEIARHRGAVFIDLFSLLSQRTASAPRLTDNGLHLNPAGLHAVAEIIAQQLGAETKAANLAALRDSIVEKNHLWFDCWRPANWSFVYGDRISQLFGKPGGDVPSLRDAFEIHRPLIAKWDERIH